MGLEIRDRLWKVVQFNVPLSKEVLFEPSRLHEGIEIVQAESYHRRGELFIGEYKYLHEGWQVGTAERVSTTTLPQPVSPSTLPSIPDHLDVQQRAKLR